jgi:SanA protein
MLGTNTRLSNGWWNLFHYYRVQAIVQLVEQEKISTVLVSGDNGTVEYNEPEAMQADLIEYKVPDDMIELDYA